VIIDVFHTMRERERERDEGREEKEKEEKRWKGREDGRGGTLKGERFEGRKGYY
jgi:hypothetical protein